MRKFAVLAVSAAVFALSACNAPAEDATVTEEVATEEVAPAEDYLTRIHHSDRCQASCSLDARCWRV